MKKMFALLFAILILLGSMSAVFAETYTQNGYTLNVTNKDPNFSSTTKQNMINTFFATYPVECSRFNPNATKTVNFIIDPAYSGVAGTAGGTTTYSASYLTSKPQDYDVVTHEVMHICQSYGNSGIPGWLTEGLADYARYKYGVNNAAAGWSLPNYSSTQKYTDSYRVTARFLVWVELHYGSNVINQLDASGRTGYTSNIWVTLTGKTVDQLWSDYSANPSLTGGTPSPAKTPTATRTPSSGGGIVSGATYKIIAKCSGKVMEVAGSSTTDGAQVQQWSDNGSATQRWIVTDMGGGYYKIKNVNSSKVLDVASSSTADGAKVQQWTDNGSTAQRWQIIDMGSGYYKVVCQCSGKVLDVTSSSTTDGAKIQQWTDNGSSAQRYQFIRQ